MTSDNTKPPARGQAGGLALAPCSAFPRTAAFLAREHVAHDAMWIDFSHELEGELRQLQQEYAQLLKVWSEFCDEE